MVQAFIIKCLKLCGSFIVRQWKWFAMGGLLVVIWLLLTMWQSERKKVSELNQTVSAMQIISKGWKAQASTYRNKNGELVTKVKAITIEKEGLKSLIQLKEASWISPDRFNSLKKDNKNLSFALAAALSVNTGAVPSTVVYLPCKDSIKLRHYVYKDQYNDIDVMQTDSSRIIMGTPIFAVGTFGRPKRWFWKFQWSRWETTGEIVVPNKLIPIDSAVFIIKKR